MKMKSFFVSAIAIIGLLANATAQSIPTYVPTAGLLGWWPFNGNANDESGNGNNGTVNGATLTTDRFGNAGKAYHFDGVNDYIKCVSGGPTGNPTVTVSFWLKTSQTSAGQIFGYGSDGLSGQDFRIYINGQCAPAIFFDTYDNAKAMSTSLGTWDYYCVVYDGSLGNNTNSASLYRNGTLLSVVCFSVNISSTNIASTIPITFGRYQGTVQSLHFYGELDDIAIYNRALTQAEITALYNAAPSGNNSTAAVAPPQLMSYQAVVRNGSNQLLINAPVGMRVSILQGSANGAAVYSEKHSATTNAQGLATLAVGGGNAQSGTFSGINWANGPYFLKVETDPTGGNNYSITATSQLLSVPYALHSATSVKADNGIPAGGTEGQVITMCNGVPIWTNGGQCPARIATLDCGSATNSGNLVVTQPAYASTSVPYTGGNGSVYTAQSVPSTGVTGLTATLSAGTLANGAGSLTWTISGTPSGVGAANFAIQLGGQSCTFSHTVDAYPAGTVHCGGTQTAIVNVTNPATGKIWMDRNLGASQVATSSADAAAYGDLYQWGRRADGHQCRNSATTTTLSSTDQPMHGFFITASNAPLDWRNPQNNNLWQGVMGLNNPCPQSHRIPTSAEWEAEVLSWGIYNSENALSSQLKLPLNGYRNPFDNLLYEVGNMGRYWSSTIFNSTGIYLLYFDNNAGFITTQTHGRSHGYAVRCIKD